MAHIVHNAIAGTHTRKETSMETPESLFGKLVCEMRKEADAQEKAAVKCLHLLEYWQSEVRDANTILRAAKISGDRETWNRIRVTRLESTGRVMVAQKNWDDAIAKHGFLWKSYEAALEVSLEMDRRAMSKNEAE